MRILAKDIAASTDGAEITLSGWVHRIRDMGGITFVILRDRSGMVQLVFDQEFPLPSATPADSPLCPETVIRVRGTAAPNEKAPGGVEVRVKALEVLSGAAPDLPFQVNGDIAKIGLDTILDRRILSLRNPKILSIFRVQSTIAEAFAAYLRSQDFTEIKTSKLVNSGTEGGTNLFQVDYFDTKVCLAQSPQFYKETLVAAGFERVFEIAPVYRAEKHDTPRHINEYVSLDVEMAFIESELELIELERGLLAHIFEEVLSKNEKDLAAWDASVPSPEETAKSPVVSYEESLKIVNAEAAKQKNAGARIFDLTPEAERLICEWAEREYGVPLAFINAFPRRYRPFYTYPLDGDTDAALSMAFDAIFRGLEITSGGRRHHDLAMFTASLPRFGLKNEDLPGYMELLKYGCPPHGGFAIGLERLTQKILGLFSVKEATLFPRDRKRVEP